MWDFPIVESSVLWSGSWPGIGSEGSWAPRGSQDRDRVGVGIVSGLGENWRLLSRKT